MPGRKGTYFENFYFYFGYFLEVLLGEFVKLFALIDFLGLYNFPFSILIKLK